MASKTHRVAFALTPNEGPDGSFTLPDLYTFAGNHITMQCTVDRKRVQDVAAEKFNAGEHVTLDVALTLNDPGSDRQFANQAKQIDEVLNEVVDFSPPSPPYLRTQITGQLFSGFEVILSGTITMPQPQAAAADPVVVAAAAGAPAEALAAVVPRDLQLPAAGAVGGAGNAAVAAASNMVDVAPPPPPASDSDSGPVPAADYTIQNPVTLQRTSRPLTGDVALWLMIKMNADYLGWANYEQQIGLLFGPGGAATNAPLPGTPGYTAMYDRTQQLSRRRFLPFTDTDAYRALKVATEAFVVTWGGVVPRDQDVVSIAQLLGADTYAVNLASERLGIDISTSSGAGSLLQEMATQYFGNNVLPPTLPYLKRVVDGLRGTDAEPSAQGAQNEQILVAGQAAPAAAVPPAPAVSPAKYCGETCLWLGHLNQDFSAKLTRPPLVELIWSYWMEELQLVQTMNAISRRFQNVSGGPRDPLSQLELDSVRPLNNLIWGWVQDEQHRLPIERRAAEYQHEYGFRLFGRAVPTTHAADVRSKFLTAFHTLLNLCVPFFRQADDTTVVPDGFPLLNALREVHLILSEGAHNQFRDLPSTSRIEMLMQQWILARPEFREFLPRRAMVAYPEPWMHSVESMRKLQGWGDTNTYQFWQLATTGEQIVSSIRWSNWNSIYDPNNAANWAVFFRPEIQTYIHSYRAVTGIDVSAEPVDVQVPGIHLLRRLQEQQRIRAA